MGWWELLGSSIAATVGGVLAFILTTVPYSLFTKRKQQEKSKEASSAGKTANEYIANNNGNQNTNTGTVGGNLDQSISDNRTFSQNSTHVSIPTAGANQNQSTSNDIGELVGKLVVGVLIAIFVVALLLISYPIVLTVSTIFCSLLLGLIINSVTKTRRIGYNFPAGATELILYISASLIATILAWFGVFLTGRNNLTIPSMGDELKGLNIVEAMSLLTDKYQLGDIGFAFSIFTGLALALSALVVSAWTGIRRWKHWLQWKDDDFNLSTQHTYTAAELDSERFHPGKTTGILIILLLSFACSYGYTFDLIIFLKSLQ